LLVMDDYSAGRRPANRYDQTAIDWRKVAAVLGWPILGVAMIGGIAGWAANIGRHDAPTDALKVALPPSERALKQPESALIIPPSMEGEIEAPARNPAAEISITRPATATAARTDPPAPIPDETQATSPAGQALPTAVASASMPLSNATIARTIGRIGYACGQVASTAPAGGAGVFKVTCTSGHAYQARPVGGRYRFKRWTGG